METGLLDGSGTGRSAGQIPVGPSGAPRHICQWTCGCPAVATIDVVLTFRQTIKVALPVVGPGSFMDDDHIEADTDVEFFRADDGRTVAIYVPGTFDSFEAFPPYLDSAAEKEHLREAYAGTDPETERATKAHITADEFPLQLVLLKRPAGSRTAAHYHTVTGHPELPTRHQIMLCQSGVAELGIYTKEGEYLDTVRLERDDLVLLAEGHSVEFSEPDTRLIEIKQGPFPETDEADKIDLNVDE